MAQSYLSKWMSGEEALKLLSRSEPDLSKQIISLQAAVREGAVYGRAAGAAAERSRRWLESSGLVSSASGLTSVDTQWHSNFIERDVVTIIPVEFASYSEFLREDVLRVFKSDVPEIGGESKPPTQLQKRRRRPAKFKQLALALHNLFPGGRPPMSVDEIDRALKEVPGVGGFGKRTLENAIKEAWSDPPRHSA